MKFWKNIVRKSNLCWFNSDNASTYFKLGVEQENLLAFSEAIEYFNKAIELKPNYAMAYYGRGNAKSENSDYEGAIQDFDEAIKINPNFGDTYFCRGIIKGRKLNDYQGALQDFDKVISIYPMDAEAYFNRGVTKRELGDQNGACLDWRKARELGYSPSEIMIKEYCMH